SAGREPADHRPQAEGLSTPSGRGSSPARFLRAGDDGCQRRSLLTAVATRSTSCAALATVPATSSRTPFPLLAKSSTASAARLPNRLAESVTCLRSSAAAFGANHAVSPAPTAAPASSPNTKR